ncbi:MAG TPA: carboxypeptidase-like regulatory domain-containing protein [Burkholderiales bacterium]|nr:carboxypeptidase-like regulatory domain-containing protein [Burkholderiales bacterium]
MEFADVQSADGRKQPAVSVLTPDNDGECGYAFRTGERYVVYANRTDGGNDLRVLSCSRTQTLASASADLQYFHTLSTRSEGSHVYGTIVRPQTDPATGATQLAPISGASLTLRGPRGKFDTKTGTDGRYDVFAIPPGKYELTAAAPGVIGAMQQSFELRHSHACFVADFAFPATTPR